jgi:hypothetical protein
MEYVTLLEEPEEANYKGRERLYDELIKIHA